VGDVTTSDPYCILYIGQKRVGKTAVRTWTLNPTWNESFTISLLHLKHPLVIEIWDFDSVGSDDILGKVELDLSELPSNLKVVKNMNLERASKTIKPRGVLHFDAFLEVSYDVCLYVLIYYG
jgi:Ca2+-dependent lipid-binding protein